jgi:hypothetical protein
MSTLSSESQNKLGKKTARSRHQAEPVCHLLSHCVLAALIFRPCGRRRHVRQKCQLNFNGLQSVASQKIKFFITTALRTQNSKIFVVVIFFRLNKFKVEWWGYRCPSASFISKANVKQNLLRQLKSPRWRRCAYSLGRDWLVITDFISVF